MAALAEANPRPDELLVAVERPPLLRFAELLEAAVTFQVRWILKLYQALTLTQAKLKHVSPMLKNLLLLWLLK